MAELGYRGDARSFRRWIKIRLRGEIAATPGAARKVRLDWKPPSPRQARRLVTSPTNTMAPIDRQFVDTLRTTCPVVAAAADLANRFHLLLVERDMNALDPWLAEAVTSSLASCARGLMRDIDAVRAALPLPLPLSTRPVEGRINKLKLVKRSMYGRAGLNPLRALVVA